MKTQREATQPCKNANASLANHCERRSHLLDGINIDSVKLHNLLRKKRFVMSNLDGAIDENPSEAADFQIGLAKFWYVVISFPDTMQRNYANVQYIFSFHTYNFCSLGFSKKHRRLIVLVHDFSISVCFHRILRFLTSFLLHRSLCFLNYRPVKFYT